MSPFVLCLFLVSPQYDAIMQIEFIPLLKNWKVEKNMQKKSYLL